MGREGQPREAARVRSALVGAYRRASQRTLASSRCEPFDGLVRLLNAWRRRSRRWKAEEGQLRQGLGAHAEVLGLAIDASTAGKIGERRDFEGKHAERRGVFLISEALASLHGLDCRRPRERPLNRLPIRTMARSRD